MKKHLLLAALALTTIGNVSAADFIAKELDGRLIQFENNQNAGSCLNVTGDLVTTSPEKANLSHTAWYAEYDATENGVILSHDGKYIGRMPVVAGTTQHDFDSQHIAAVANKDEAGRYRLYPIVVNNETVYGLTCTRDTDGNLIETIGQTGGWGNTTGWWISDGGTGNGTPVNRWGTGASTSKWKYRFIDEVEVPVNKTTGNLYNNGTTNIETIQSNWALLWKSDKDDTLPEVHINVGANNMTYSNNNLVIASGQTKSCDYVFTCEDPMYYVAKVKFDFTGGNGTTLTVNDISMNTSATSQTFEFECSYGENASFHMEGTNQNITTSNFIVTLRKVSRLHYITSLIDSTYGAYANSPEIWDANLVNQAITSLKSQLDTAFSTYVTSAEVEAANAICDANLSEHKKQIDATADGKTVTFRNLLHDTRYISTAEALETYEGGGATGGLRVHTTDNPDDLNAVWTLIFDNATGAFRLQNYLNEREIGHTTATEAPVIMAEDGENGHLYEIQPIHYKDASHEGYTVALWDRTANDKPYLHCGGQNLTQIPEGGQRVVKWSSAVNDAAASAWFINLVEIVNQMDALKSLEGHDVIISDIDNGTYLAAVSDTEVGFIQSVRPSAIWNIQVNTKTGKLSLKNLIKQTYANDLTSPLSNTDNSTIKVDDVESMLDTWHIISQTATPTEEDAKYSIKAISDEQKEAMILELHALFSTKTIGYEPGLFAYETETDNETYYHTIDAIDSFNSEDGFNYTDANAAFTFAETKTPVLFDLNAIEGPALIQMAYTPNNVSNYNGQFSGDNQVSDSNISDILAFSHNASTFVLSDGKLHSLNTGHGIVLNENNPKMYDGEDWSENINNAISVEFISNPKTNLSTSPDGVARVCYGIARPGVNNWVFGGATASGHHLVRYHNVANTAAVAYTIWYVKNLTIDVEEGGNKLWRTPVAVNFGGNEESGAYVVSVNGTRITTTAVDGSDTYGAGTIFILTKTVNLNVENGRNIAAETAGLGHHAKQMHTMTAGKVYLSIHTEEAPEVAPAAEVNGYTMYFDGPVATNTVKMDVVIPTEDTQKLLEAHEALIEATNSTEDPLQHGTTMELALGGSSDTTMLTEITAEGRNGNSVYDLQGRKLAAPAKGFNIINGKKVLVK